MSAPFSHAQLLRERGRHEEAVAALHLHLAHHPDDPDAYLELAINRSEIPGELNNALEDARRATSLEPWNSVPLAMQARILNRLERHKEALEIAESAIAIDPESPFCWTTKALALIGLSRWKEAEQAAREALALDAEDETASNLLSHSLRLQNRLAESEEESRRRLARDPDNAFSFANSGWAALQRGQVKEAETLFLEALRIDPQMEHAREGLKQSYRARSAFFRLFLKWAFFMNRFSENHRIGIMIGLLVGFKVLRVLFASVHPLLVIPLAIAYYLFIFGTWLAGGLANFILLKDPIARMSLDRGEKTEGIAVGVLFLGGVILGAAGLAVENHPLAIAGAAMMVAALPASMIFTNPSGKGRLLFSAIALVVIGCGATMVVDLLAHPGRELLDGLAGAAFSLGVLSAVACTWLAAVPALRNAKPS